MCLCSILLKASRTKVWMLYSKTPKAGPSEVGNVETAVVETKQSNQCAQNVLRSGSLHCWDVLLWLLTEMVPETYKTYKTSKIRNQLISAVKPA